MVNDLSKTGSELITDKGIATLRFNLPPANILTEPEFIDPRLLLELANDDTTLALIVTGAGRHFSSGADPERINLIADRPDLLLSKMLAGSELLRTLSALTIPVVAAVNGVCFGGGLEVALACHMRIASPKAYFAFPDVNHGWMPGLGGIYIMVHRTGTAATLLHALGGNIFDAPEALRSGVGDLISPDAKVYDYTLEYMHRLVDNRPKIVVTSIVGALNNAARMKSEEALAEETKLFCRLATREGAGK